MIFIGNYKNKILTKGSYEKILGTIGQARPKDWPPAFAVETAEYKKAEQAGYDLNATNWWVYESKDLDIKINTPWTDNNIHWWITKLMPGQFMPMHTDPHTHSTNCKRFWIPLQDYVPGHIFIYQNELIKDYSQDDVFEYIDATDSHGAANISHSPRLVLQITEYL